MTFIFQFQVQSTEASRCSVNWTEISTSSDSVQVRFSSSGGQSCNFSLQTADESQAQSDDCDPGGETGTGFICNITALQPGTLYNLTVISNKDGERSHASVRTGEFT